MKKSKIHENKDQASLYSNRRENYRLVAPQKSNNVNS